MPVVGLVVVAVVVAPALALDAATERGGADRTVGLDLIATSAAVGLAYALLLAGRLYVGGTDAWLAAVHAVVVLALAASALPAAALHSTARLHAWAADSEWAVLVAWASFQVVAVLLAEGTRRLSLRWLSR